MKAVHTISDWSAIFRDSAVWRPLVAAVARRHEFAGSVGGLQIEPGHVAGTHAVFVINQEWVVKLFGPFWPADHEQEVAALLLLAPKPHLLEHVRLPQMVASGVLEAGVEGAGGRAWPYVVTTFLPGTQLCDVWPDLVPADRRRLAGELGHALADLHARPVGDSITSERYRQDWLRFVADQAAQAQQRHLAWGSLPAHLIADLPDFLQRAEPLPRKNWCPALLHCDVTPEHILLQRAGEEATQDWRLSGLIDFGDAMIGDPEYEFLALFLAGLSHDQGAFRTFLRAYGYLDARAEGLAGRLMAYMLLHVYPLTEALTEQARAELWGASNLNHAAAALFGPSTTLS